MIHTVIWATTARELAPEGVCDCAAVRKAQYAGSRTQNAERRSQSAERTAQDAGFTRFIEQEPPTEGQLC